MRTSIRDMLTRGFTSEARRSVPFLHLIRKPRETLDGHPWHVLSADEAEALREGGGIGDSLSCHLNTLTGESGMACGSFGEGIDIPVPGRLQEPFPERERPDPYFCFSHRPLHRGIPTEIGTTLAMLRPGDRMRLLWWEDGLSTEIVRRAGLHHDLLLLEVERGGRVLKFQLDQAVSRPGSGRMIRTFDPAQEPGLARRAAPPKA